MPLCALPYDVLVHIAYHTALADPLGPPAHLVPLLLTCSHINALLSLTANPHLYARIFRAKFDHRAASRRLHEDAAYTQAHALQLVHYSRALANIRRGDIYSPSLRHDFYRAFTLCLENDGRNVDHLLWAGLPQFVHRYILERLWEGREAHHSWPCESPENAFALWLYWFSLDQHSLMLQPPDSRDHLLFLLRPFAFYNFRYPPFLAPDNHVHLPLVAHPDRYNDHSAITPHGFYPQYRDPSHIRHSFLHYGATVSIAEPPIGLVAKLLYVAINEHDLFEIPSLVPVDRDAAIDEGFIGPTQADYLEFASRWAVHLPDALHDAPEEPQDRPSTRHDTDWERLRVCADPWNVPRARMPVYTPGSLSGMWGGLYLTPDLENYHVAMSADEFTSELERPHMTTSTTPLYFALREHHSVSPAVPLPHWEVLEHPFDEGIMNAYCPRGFPSAYAISHRDGVLRIQRRGAEYVYETFAEGKENSHDEHTCEMCLGRRRTAEHELGVEDADVDMDAEDARVEYARRAIQATLPPGLDLDALIEHERASDREYDASADSRACSEAGSDDDDDDSASDGGPGVSHTCSGIQDVIITGETLREHALAWGDFSIYGRVRAWDGLVVLVRAPVWLADDAPPHNTYVFRGYLVGGANLVGAWRHVTDSVHTVPVEGPFVVSRVPPGKDRAAQA